MTAFLFSLIPFSFIQFFQNIIPQIICYVTVIYAILLILKRVIMFSFSCIQALFDPYGMIPDPYKQTFFQMISLVIPD